VVNATGVQVDEVRRLDDAQVKPLVRPSQGIHLVVDASFLPGDEAVLVPSTEDGRVLFMVPWLGKVLLGTTDTPRNAISTEPRALEEEIDFVLRTCAGYLSRPPTLSDVRSVFAGLRPLVQNNDSDSTARLSREHTIATSASGLITVTGGKWTTYRRMAADVVDEVVTHTGLAAKPCQTETLRLHGAESGDAVDRYGADRAALAALAGFDRLLHPRLDLTEAHVRFACRHEAARTVEDVLARRHRALFLDAQAAREAARPVAGLMAAELGHDVQWVERQVQAFEALASGYEVESHWLE
jgi:glycerol-3-phosphate dehydrogenase